MSALTYLFSLLALMAFPRLWFACYAQHSNHALSCDLYEAPNCKLSMELNEQTGMVSYANQYYYYYYTYLVGKGSPGLCQVLVCVLWST